MRRPVGVTIIAVFALIGGLLQLVGGLSLLGAVTGVVPGLTNALTSTMPGVAGAELVGAVGIGAVVISTVLAAAILAHLFTSTVRSAFAKGPEHSRVEDRSHAGMRGSGGRPVAHG